MTKTTATAKIRKSTRTKEKIIDSYLHLMLNKKWDKISVKELCSYAEITRGTFYQYYDDIYDLMESLETSLLDDLTNRYTNIHQASYAVIPEEHFIDKFDYAPPEMLLTWFEFCKEHHKAIKVLLDRKNGDSYFIQRVKQILTEYINYMMDCDGRPKDELRAPFVHLFLEMHLLAAQLWIEDDENDFLPIDEIVNLLNTTRVGGSYLSYKRRCDPDFDLKMKIKKRTTN